MRPDDDENDPPIDVSNPDARTKRRFDRMGKRIEVKPERSP